VKENAIQRQTTHQTYFDLTTKVVRLQTQH